MAVKDIEKAKEGGRRAYQQDEHGRHDLLWPREQDQEMQLVWGVKKKLYPKRLIHYAQGTLFFLIL